MSTMDKIYCGADTVLPAEYDRHGTRSECLKCGFGAAMMKYKWMPASNSPKPPPRRMKGCFRPRKQEVHESDIRRWILEELRSKQEKRRSPSRRRRSPSRRRRSPSRRRRSPSRRRRSPSRRRRSPSRRRRSPSRRRRSPSRRRRSPSRRRRSASETKT